MEEETFTEELQTEDKGEYMAFVNERITDKICKRLKDYGYAYEGSMYPKLYSTYRSVASIIQMRLGLKKGFLNSGLDEGVLFAKVEEMLDQVLPAKR